jgi:hypothetical protein
MASAFLVFGVVLLLMHSLLQFFTSVCDGCPGEDVALHDEEQHCGVYRKSG